MAKKTETDVATKNHLHRYKKAGEWRRKEHFRCEEQGCVSELWRYKGYPAVVNPRHDMSVDYKPFTRKDN